MTERLADITARIEGIRQLGSVVNAMRGIAAARSQQARNQLAAVEAYSASLAASISRVVALMPEADGASAARATRPALVIFAAEQGFAGAFSERVFDAIEADLASVPIFLVGSRAATVAAERKLAVEWTGRMPSQSKGIPALANTIAEALYRRIAEGSIDRLDTIFSRWQAGAGIKVEQHSLFPLDPSRFRGRRQEPPLLNLPARDLLGDLTMDYVHAQLCDAALHAFSAENQARMEAMASARNQIERRLADLQANRQRVRQEEITAEIIELASGEIASQRPKHPR